MVLLSGEARMLQCSTGFFGQPRSRGFQKQVAQKVENLRQNSDRRLKVLNRGDYEAQTFNVIFSFFSNCGVLALNFAFLTKKILTKKFSNNFLTAQSFG